jgi:hypothetical protein
LVPPGGFKSPGGLTLRNSCVLRVSTRYAGGHEFS